MHHTHHASDVEHGYHAQALIFGCAVGPQTAGHRIVHDGAMGVHAAFGQARGTAGVGQHGQVFWAGRYIW